MNCFTFHSDMKPCDTKRQVTTEKKNDRKADYISYRTFIF